jgi:hypothetical protein
MIQVLATIGLYEDWDEIKEIFRLIFQVCL